MNYIDLYEKKLVLNNFKEVKKDELKFLKNLPKDFLQFIIKNNNCEGFVGDKGDYIKIFDLEKILLVSKEKNMDGIIFIGNNGGGEYYAFNIMKNYFVQIPSVDCKLKNQIFLGKTFNDFLKSIHRIFD